MRHGDRVGLLAVLLGLCVCGAPQRLDAQAPRLDSVRSALFDVERGTPIRVAPGTGGIVQGPLERVEGDALLLGPDPGAVYGLAAIDTLWVRGRATRRGAKIGAIAGGIGGGLFGGFVGLLGANLCEYECPDETVFYYTGWVTAGGLAGALGGAGLGALIGSAFPRWHREFP